MNIAALFPRASKVIKIGILALGLAGCVGGREESSADPEEPTQEAKASLSTFERRALTEDIVEYSAIVPVGPGAADRIRIHRVVRERAPFKPRSTRAAIM